MVKNVAGYDLTRLVTGSAGTLAFITELTFRVLSMPERCVVLVASGPLERCGAAATKLLRSPLEPTFVVAVCDDAGLEMNGHSGWQLIAGFEGFEETVTFQVESCRALLAAEGLQVAEPREYLPREGLLGEMFGILDQSPFLLRTDLPLDGAIGFLSAQQEVLRGAVLLADLGCGRITAAMPVLTDDVWMRLCEVSSQAGGHTILENAPPSFKKRQDVFGPPQADWQVMHRIKAALDPHNVFAPGRLPGRK